MDGTPQSPSLPRRLGRFLRRQWPLVAFVLVAVGSTCLVDKPCWHLCIFGTVCSIFLLKKFHLEHLYFLYILPLLATFFFIFIVSIFVTNDKILNIFFPNDILTASFKNSLCAALYSLPFSPFFFKKFSLCKSLVLIPALSFFISLAHWSLYTLVFFSYIIFLALV
ncbi:hypothetical protein [uncultured Desulfovibrio sp.]|uniref:hypothetical protein n=1 Tax=uncultured Desulfovibrio sp. TaxID=167968 RepID=UPI002803DBE8|nr:hypothetical protein [uncultured Desulfovibrio sp.]